MTIFDHAILANFGPYSNHFERALFQNWQATSKILAKALLPIVIYAVASHPFSKQDNVTYLVNIYGARECHSIQL